MTVTKGKIGAMTPTSEPKPAGLSRRDLLRAAAAAGVCALLPAPVFAQAPPAWRRAVTDYLGRHARPDGGYAWEGQAESHLTPTYAAVGCYHVLGQPVPAAADVARFVRAGHPFRRKTLERDIRVFEFQQIQALLWLGEDASAFRKPVRGWTRPMHYATQYEKGGNPVFHNELTAFTCRELLGLSADDLAAEFVPYVDERRRENGSFNNVPAADGGDGHVMNTLWGLQALRVLGRLGERRAEAVQWLRSCQRPGGGFTHAPRPEFAGNEDVAYTWAAVRGLALLDAEPADRAACVRSLWSLCNADGGFGDRPGLGSNPVATYYALDALAALDALDSPPADLRPAVPRVEPLPDGLKVFSFQIEAHGQGSPAEAVDLARALKIHLWGAKNAKPGWIARAQALADREQVPVTFVAAQEEYGTWVAVPGLGTYSHTSDLIAPAGAEIGPSLASAGVVSWPEFRRRLAPLQQADGRLVWQFGENEELTRLYLDDSLARGGYAAISTFHFGNPDFTNSSPFLYQYRGRIPFIALQDAHGPEPWWFADMTTGFRTLFLAKEPTWAGWLDALRHNRVAAVRHDSVSGGATWMHAGRLDVAEFLRRHETDWRWWDNPAVRRPLVSIVAVTPADEFEAARPEQGVTLRVRCAWQNTTQGQPKTPLAELVSLTVDGSAVRPELVTRQRSGKKGLADHYHRVHLATPSPGEHTATAVVRELATGTESSRTLRFTV